MKQADLEREVSDVIDAKIDAGEKPVASWIVQEVVAAHPPVDGEDPFYSLCAYEHTRDTVRAVVQRYRASEGPTAPENLFPGFKRLQRRYLIDCDGEQVVVKVEDLTWAQGSVKVEELERMGRGCFTHAKELRRYLEDRREAV